MQRSFFLMVALLVALTVAACAATPATGAGGTATAAPAASATADRTPTAGADTTPAAGPATPTTQASVPTAAATASASTAYPDATIVLRRTGGFAGRHDEWTIYGDGRVVDDAGKESQVDVAEVAALVDQAKAVGFFQSELSPPKASQCADCFRYALSISTGTGEENGVGFEDAQQDVPQGILDLMSAVRELATGGE